MRFKLFFLFLFVSLNCNNTNAQTVLEIAEDFNKGKTSIKFNVGTRVYHDDDTIHLFEALKKDPNLQISQGTWENAYMDPKLEDKEDPYYKKHGAFFNGNINSIETKEVIIFSAIESAKRVYSHPRYKDSLDAQRYARLPKVEKHFLNSLLNLLNKSSEKKPTLIMTHNMEPHIKDSLEKNDFCTRLEYDQRAFLAKTEDIDRLFHK